MKSVYLLIAASMSILSLNAATLRVSNENPRTKININYQIAGQTPKSVTLKSGDQMDIADLQDNLGNLLQLEINNEGYSTYTDVAKNLKILAMYGNKEIDTKWGHVGLMLAK